MIGKSTTKSILILIIIITSLSCVFTTQNSHPVPSGQGGGGVPTNEPQRRIEPVPPDQINSQTKTTKDEGKVEFVDALTDQSIVVQVTAKNEQTPISNIQVSFASNGTEILLIALDPNNIYVPLVKEIAYVDLRSNSNHHGSAKLAAPANQISLAAVLVLITFVEIDQTIQSWAAILNDLPKIDKWSNTTKEICINTDQLQKGEEAVLNTVFLSFGLAGKGIGNAFSEFSRTKFLVLDEKAAEGLGVLFENFFQEKTSESLESVIAKQSPYIVRWKIYTIKGVVPYFARPEGYCLEPLKTNDAQSILDWVKYGLEKHDRYAFTHLPISDRIGYTNYIEGGQDVSKQGFLNDISKRLPSSSPECDGYIFEDSYYKIWTHGWNPAWEMTEMCYIGCSQINPPYRSDISAFFFVNQNSEWKLQTVWLNDTELFSLGSSYRLNACDLPVASTAQSNGNIGPEVQSSCPGAPTQRIIKGNQGFVCTKNDSVALRQEPRRSADIILRLKQGAKFNVIGGASCSDGWSWWQVETQSGSVGWISEGGDAVDPYFICPIP